MNPARVRRPADPHFNELVTTAGDEDQPGFLMHLVGPPPKTSSHLFGRRHLA